MNEAIAIIDGGVNVGLYNNGKLQFDIEVDSDLNITERVGEDPNSPSHGTTCAAIIKKYAGDAPIGSIKVFSNKQGRGFKHQLIKALYWCAENGVRLANLSLGTIDFRDFAEIRSCVNLVSEQGLIIVAACSNRNVYTVPACLTNAIGVKCRKIYTDEQYMFNKYTFNGIDIGASGRHCLTDSSGNIKNTNPSNSFAAPLITAKTYKIMRSNPGISLEGIKKELYKDAINFRNDCYNPYMYMNIDWIEGSADINDSGINNIAEYTGKKIWEPNFYRKNLQKSLTGKHDKIDIPVIDIYTSGDKHIFYSLHSLFEKNGYYSIKVSTDYTDMIRGGEYLPEGVDVGSFLAAVYKKYNCDIILLWTGGIKPAETSLNAPDFDVVLHVKDNENLCTCKEICHGKCCESVLFEVSSYCVREHADKIFNKIVEVLT